MYNTFLMERTFVWRQFCSKETSVYKVQKDIFFFTKILFSKPCLLLLIMYLNLFLEVTNALYIYIIYIYICIYIVWFLYNMSYVFIYILVGNDVIYIPETHTRTQARVFRNFYLWDFLLCCLHFSIKKYFLSIFFNWSAYTFIMIGQRGAPPPC